MPGDDALLTLVQWLSPTFPVGGFAYSHGLEWALAEGEVATAADVGAWVGEVLRHGAGATDAALLAAAMAPGADHAGLDALARALAPCEERWIETRDQGAAFAAAVNAATGSEDAPAALPVAVGRAAGRLGLEQRLVAGIYLQAFATNLVLAAVRFVPLGAGEGQRIVASLRPVCLAVAEQGVATRPEEVTTAAIGAELAAMRHARLEHRTFRT
jgi:urease accessory protein